jgi:hypothetical protein
MRFAGAQGIQGAEDGGVAEALGDAAGVEFVDAVRAIVVVHGNVDLHGGVPTVKGGDMVDAGGD